MLSPVDLHPDDAAVRDRIAEQLRASRVAAGVGQRELAIRLGVDQRRVVLLERRRQWRTATVQGWARALDQRLSLTIRDLAVPDDGDALAAVYDQQQPTNPVVQDRLLLRRVANDLTRIRRTRMSAYHFGLLIGRGEGSVLWREAHPDGALLGTLQQTTRALGGSLEIDVVTAGVSCVVV